jgi:16S rRNA (cytidine1402-2'-O)-methyltransferase
MKLGMKVALVSDAGTPTISDPGNKLVSECYNQGISISSLPGPSAVMVAASASGMAADRLIFEGYLSKTKGARLNTLKYLKNQVGASAVIFENPLRLTRTLYEIITVYGEDREVYVGVEFTKMYEK